MANINKFESWLTANKPITDEQYKEFQEYGNTKMSKQEQHSYWKLGEGIELLRLTSK
ncbi:hypothetical protein Aegir_gp16 [Pelagibacter phage Aegir EXVC013S]|nr:hypothetical protein Aegir_gp16 [Pelagibacter phage Aegir EXVC013S]QLF88506.1 hypothetical protein Kolga_gp60 [Pelagibacter phage Kolga EXVC016S]